MLHMDTLSMSSSTYLSIAQPQPIPCAFTIYIKTISVLTNSFPRYYCLSILDKHHHPDISYEEGLKLLEMCTDELKRRLPIDFKGVCS
jgi:hypothetical protein